MLYGSDCSSEVGLRKERRTSLIPGANEAGVKRGATSVTCRLRESDAANRQDVRAITQLHLKLLGHGPMARQRPLIRLEISPKKGQGV